MFKFIKNLFKKEKIEPPQNRGIIKMTESAKEAGIFDDENKIVELHKNGRIENVKYSEELVEVLRDNGIPVLPEEDTEENKWTEFSDEGSFETFRR